MLFTTKALSVEKNITMKLAIATLLAGSAAAFSPAKTGKASTSALSMSFENELGVQPPLGFYDPLKICADCDQERFDRLRYVEIKHGRIAMLAVAGYLLTMGGVRLPGNISYDGTKFADIPAGFAALDKVPKFGLIQIAFFIGILEVAVMRDNTGDGLFPGDFRNNYIDFGWDKFDAETQYKKRAIELNQGRAAMMGILALMVHEKLGVSLLPGITFD